MNKLLSSNSRTQLLSGTFLCQGLMEGLAIFFPHQCVITMLYYAQVDAYCCVGGPNHLNCDYIFDQQIITAILLPREGLRLLSNKTHAKDSA